MISCYCCSKVARAAILPSSTPIYSRRAIMMRKTWQWLDTLIVEVSITLAALSLIRVRLATIDLLVRMIELRQAMHQSSSACL